ncbi:sensor domain-containing protein, partial [Catenulispora sp. NF23]|uniref:sensor histidine kinase n=1 Tax=Catenulispora pinistramenti TaxID=2705254 RepID=UPI001BAC31FD
MLEQWVRQTAVRFPPAAGYVLVCLGTGLAGLVLLALTAAVCALCLVGTGFLVLPATLRVVTRYAQFHRRRVGRLLGVQVRTAYQGVPDGSGSGLGSGLGSGSGSGSAIAPKPSLRDPAVRKDLLWLLCHSVPGTALCVLALVVCGHAVNWLTAPLWWLLLPAQRDRIILLTVDSWWKALAAVVVGVGYALVAMALMRPLALLHAHVSRRLLTARARTGLAERVRALTVSRAEALDAHDAELRRIERDLHDGAQADIVAVSLRLGMIRRALDRRPEQVPELLDVAQQQAEKALDALRQLVRGIYPPVLADRGLVEAVRALAALCAVPTRTDFE